MFGNKIKVDEELYEKIKKCAALAGYATADEFATHVLEKEIARILGSGDASDADDEEAKKQLQGLGYIE